MVNVKPLNTLLDYLRARVRIVMKHVAYALNRLSGGKVTPNAVTLIGLLMHLPIAWLIATNHYILAGILLIIFGLFDALDGELARLQKKDSAGGMLLDASTDRMKEVMLYTGAAYGLVATNQANYAAWAVIACGASLCVSYVKAKGETAIAKTNMTVSEINRLFQDGFMRFELRMCLLILGLFTDHLLWAVIAIAVLSTLTAIERLVKISRRLRVQS
ncbi:MAG: phosphatidylglycerophosphate synthase [Candidatus Saccharibacteria bacterium]|nr:phosphatidylglycerophosphate synthase [Candidatus Saccharibacteria bacterium]